MTTRSRPALLATAALVASTLLSACTTTSPTRKMSCEDARPPPIQISPDGLTATTHLSVLTYNIEGLRWPARKGRGSELRQIGEHLARLRESGSPPDVVLFQEMFSGDAKDAVAASGYPAISTGPRKGTKPHGSTRKGLPGRAKWRRGEIGMRLTGSGLATASRYPVVHTDRRAYGWRSCAGLDCLANKGIEQVRIWIPGVPTPIDIYNTHMNSRGASKAPINRNTVAHDRQTLEASEFIEATHDDSLPVIFGGDFNMRHSEARWENFTRYQQMTLVHRVCAKPDSECDVQMSWDGDEPWMDTQDLQFFDPGYQTSIRPVRVEAMFDGGPNGPQLSDHDGFMVTYELSWAATETSAAPAACKFHP